MITNNTFSIPFKVQGWRQSSKTGLAGYPCG
jgi:hypothetical protein